MQLSRKILQKVNDKPGIVVPGDNIFSLPEKVLQFGTGVLLRGLPDYFIDKANRTGIFNGRIVIVKSTSRGSTDEFSAQDNLYTLEVRGLENGKHTKESIINSSISRVLTAASDWDAILACAANPHMEIIISNTTEIGIAYSEDNIFDLPPGSFPGKLLAFLHARFQTFNGSGSSGMIIIPTELIPENGNRLKEIILKLAHFNDLGAAFTTWLMEANHFCNSLVDRIVPGKLAAADKTETEQRLGYRDDLLMMAEPFRLWAIESRDAMVKEKLSFAMADHGVRIEPSIEKFRELKLRLLNGTHSFTCALAILSGFKTVRDAMENETFNRYIKSLMEDEISPAIHNDIISETDTDEFAHQVADRFSNPYLDHQWMSIAVQYSSKMKMRNVPLVLRHYQKTAAVPEKMALGFAAFILFMNKEGNQNKGVNGQTENLNVEDENVAIFNKAWNRKSNDGVVKEILGNKDFWGTDLAGLPGFAPAVELYLQLLVKKTAIELMELTSKNKVNA